MAGLFSILVFSSFAAAARLLTRYRASGAARWSRAYLLLAGVVVAAAILASGPGTRPEQAASFLIVAVALLYREAVPNMRKGEFPDAAGSDGVPAAPAADGALCALGLCILGWGLWFSLTSSRVNLAIVTASAATFGWTLAITHGRALAHVLRAGDEPTVHPPLAPTALPSRGSVGRPRRVPLASGVNLAIDRRTEDPKPPDRATLLASILRRRSALGYGMR